ncbi:bifunctional 4-hydroxy-3-methylbut-2-enyl diphosphate reductase/30S ribosomal protein S1 [Halanaerobiaceae bacterium Z-7014]|uniref:4-hydroxy-3-methylbut-2-enyl diphosphate reductase n=1 Tax=Halonatronomonas betaini TaxID=2778430 RepID=A0A931F6C2_9FIRM|nr:bifunctional 4-hydroxy-3-methylbut-2-enyl diphosphate reductase/30S ribosomal protein S1 [Halonatronomonas betaini]
MKVLEITTAEEAGFCFGVKRAIDMAMEAVQDESDIKVYTLGPIIHNPQVVEKLEELGIRSVEDLSEIDSGVIIIRSHGVEPKTIEQAENKGLTILDATCPYVKKAQKNAQLLMEEGYQTLIYGDQDHPEVKGILGATDYKALIVEDKNDLDEIDLQSKVGIVAQTTKSPASFKELIGLLLNRVKELKIYNTICNTTQVRQSGAENLADDVEIMFVIGGFNSANTNRLAEICSNTGTPTYHIETAEDIEWSWLENINKIGITAGASTPDWLIKEVIQAMSEEKKDLEIEEKEQEEIEELEKKEENDEVIETKEEPEVEEVEASEETETDEAEQSETDEVEETEESEEEEVFQYSDNDIANLEKGQTVEGTVVEINDQGVYVDVNYKTDGFIPLRELSNSDVSDPHDEVSLDEEIKVVILTLEDDEGNMILSKKRADQEVAWDEIEKIHENDEVIEAEVKKEVKGGLVADVGLRGFIPASHVSIGYVEDLSDFVGQTLRLKVIEVDRNNNNVVLSAKKVMEEERAEAKVETLENLEKGQELTGTVTKLVDFGAFVDIGGIEGLLHISEMSWGRIDHPSSVLEEGQEVKVKVLEVDRENERISLGYKQLLPDPWEEFARKHYEGEVIEGKVTKIVDFGAFMEVEEGIEGLIHISQLSHRHVKTADEVVSVDEEREAKIINIDPEQKRVGLSIKELEEPEEKEKTVSSSSSSNDSKGSSSDDKSDKSEEEMPSGATIGERLGDLKSLMDDDEQ